MSVSIYDFVNSCYRSKMIFNHYINSGQPIFRMKSLFVVVVVPKDQFLFICFLLHFYLENGRKYFESTDKLAK